MTLKLSDYLVPSVRPEVVVFSNPSCESRVRRLIDAVPSVSFTMESAPVDLGLETQQLQVAEREAMVDGIQSQLDSFSREHPQTGPVHVYLLDGKGLSSGDSGSQATLHAMAAAALSDPTHTLAAFLPEDKSLQSPGLPDGTPDAIQDVVKQFLADSDAPALESYDSLLARLKAL